MGRTLMSVAALAAGCLAGATSVAAQEAPAPAGRWSFAVGAATDNAGTDREGYLIEKGLRRRQWQRQQDAAVGAAASSKAAADAPVGAVMAGAGCAGPACIT